MVKRVTATIFLLIFTASMLGRSIERAEVWAAEHKAHSKHSAPHHSATGIAEAHKQGPRQGQTKLSEDGSVLHASFVRSFNAPPSIGILAHGLTGFVADPNGQTVSSRAPPSLLS